MGKKLTELEILKKATEKHEGRYRYPDMRYTSRKNAINIECSIHGEFRQIAAYHLAGSGCPKCANNIKQGLDNFIGKARKIHGKEYDYSGSVYVNNKTKLTISCSKHGDFQQAPSHHLAGVGCPTCKGGVLLNNDKFIMKAREVHGYRYSYDQIQYLSAKKKVKIECGTHGFFYQIAQEHYNGAGCPKCDFSYKPNTSEFIKKARCTHGDRYDYSLTEYTTCVDEIKIICKTHGVFNQRAADHIKGRGCRRCTHYGFNTSKGAYIYLLLDTDTSSAVKVGITNNVDKRIKQLKKSTPFGFQVLEVISVKGEWAIPIEKFYHSHLVNLGMKGFNGSTEWFEFNGDVIRSISSWFR
ncbi:endonuclease [Vibrio phage 234P10]|nr:hypothetical protein SIPHO062v1_p0005 [Vibrio phage PS17B.1]